jgi:phosphohistidine phosphatase
MRLYLMRHALAVSREAFDGDDARRPLTEAGHRQARQVAAGLKRLQVSVGAVVTSPYARAVQTAEHVACVFGPGFLLKKLEELEPSHSPHRTSEALRAFAMHEHLLLVGHEPHLSDWLGELVTGHHGLRCLMKKGGVACVEVDRVPPDAGSGMLRWFLTPKQLTLIGKSP